LTAAITALSDYNSRPGRALTEAIETANTARAERRARQRAGLCGGDGVAWRLHVGKAGDREKFGDGLLKFNDEILSVIKKWQDIVQSDDAQQFATFKKRIEQFVDFRKELVRRAIEINPAAGREWGDNDENRAVRTALNKDLEALANALCRTRQTDRRADHGHQANCLLS